MKMQILEKNISDQERKRNRENLAEMLVERKRQSEREMAEDRKNPKYQAIVAMLKEKIRKN
jgi:hypothetical protein